jgi:flagellar biosynthesis protein FliR
VERLSVAAEMKRVMPAALLQSCRIVLVGAQAYVEASSPLFLWPGARVVGVGTLCALRPRSVLPMASVALAYVARALPSMQISNAGFAVLLATGTAVLVISLPAPSREHAIDCDANRFLERLSAELSGR